MSEPPSTLDDESPPPSALDDESPPDPVANPFYDQTHASEQHQTSAPRYRRSHFKILARRAASMRLAGWRVDAIAERLGVGRERAKRLLADGLESLHAEEKPALVRLRDEEVMRLDRLWATHWPDGLQEDLTQAKTEREKREVIVRSQRAALILIKISELRAKLLGLLVAPEDDAFVQATTFTATFGPAYTPPPQQLEGVVEAEVAGGDSSAP